MMMMMMMMIMMMMMTTKQSIACYSWYLSIAARKMATMSSSNDGHLAETTAFCQLEYDGQRRLSGNAFRLLIQISPVINITTNS